MMAQPTGYDPVSVVSPHFCVPHPIDIAITKKVWDIGHGNFVVNDVNGNLMFKVEGSFFSFDDRRVILDATGIPIVTLKKKV